VIRARQSRPLVIGHRGARAVAPENTLASFAAAVAAGADVVELDVGAGLVVAHSAAELPDEPVTLDEALDFVRSTRAGVLVDLKYPGIEVDVAAAVRRHALLDRAAAASTSVHALRRLKDVEPRLLRSISYPNDRYRVSRFAWPRTLERTVAATVRTGMPARVPLLLTAARTRTLTLHHALVSPAVVRAARARDAALVAWTVNDPARIVHLAELGVDGVVTDDPEKAVGVLATMERR
jgi:glycerophosphoryl diester phosphodiesterase